MESVGCPEQELSVYRSKDEARYKYRVGDLVYSLWKGQLWKALILDTSLKMHPSGWHPIYYVGYVTNHRAGSGSYYFNKSHNEWKSEALIFEIDGDTRKKSVETQRLLRSAIKEGDLKTVEEILARLNIQQEVKISTLNLSKVEDVWFDFSETVYAVLVHDKNQISRGKLVELPKNPSVECIFKEYIAYLKSLEKKRKISPETRVQEAVLEMLTELFNKALKKRLIYPSEMHQVGHFEEGTVFSKVFGIEHLLRLLVILPKLLGDYISFGECSFSLDVDGERDDLDYLVLKSIKLELIKTVNSFIDYFNSNFQKLSIAKYNSFSNW